MQLFACLLLVTLAVTVVTAQSNFIQSGGSVCSSEESSEEQDRIVEECSAEVESAIFVGLDKTMQRGSMPISGVEGLRRRREVNVSPTERRVSGCLLQCIFRRYKVLGEDELPTRRGLMSVISEGTTDRAYFMAASRITDHCYSKVRDFRHQHQARPAAGGEYCDLAYDLFDCVSQEIDEFCEGK